MDKWTSAKIGSLGRVITGKTPPTADVHNFGGQYPFITIPDLNGRVFINSADRTLSEVGANILRSCLLPPGTVMMSCIATIGRCGITTIPSFTNQQINSVIPAKSVDARFLYYAFTQLGAALDAAGGGGSVYTNVSKGRFSDIEIQIPETIQEQRAISSILGALDDKIDLNRRMNETLEATARTIFKDWFVDFGPTRAKMEGSAPYLAPEIWSLFPDRLDNEGKPQGWGWGRIDDLAEVSSGKRPDARFDNACPEGSIPLWGGNGPMAFVATPLVKRPILLTGRVGTLGSVFRIMTPCWPSDNTLISSARQSRNFEYIYFQLKEVDFVSLNRGSTQPLLTQTDLKAQTIVIPPQSTLEQFSKIASSIFDKVDACQCESDTLTTTRDLLLPKLMSGEIRVCDAEKLAEAAA